MSFWSLTHVFQKVGKLEPPLANTNATTTVVFVAIVAGIIASAEHRFPRTVSII